MELGADDFRELFEQLATKLARKHVVGTIHLVGGAAMVLAYGFDGTTADADGEYNPDGPVREAVNEVARENGLSSTWLNNQASVYFSREALYGPVVFNHPNLGVYATAADHALAMKVRSARGARNDLAHARTLVSYLGISTRDEVLETVAKYFPGEALGERQLRFVDSLHPPTDQDNVEDVKGN
jgi:hypothetical protein